MASRFRFDGGVQVDLRAIDPGERSGLDKHEGEARTEAVTEALATLQASLYAEARHAVLVVLQGMDAAGKDGTVKHVLSGVNPQGVDVHAFKQPGPVERAHDYLWRIHQAVPARGRIGIFNRSHYEDVLAPRVHPELLGEQRPDAAFWRQRFDDIVAFERYLAHQGVVILKFFLHISKAEQRRRLLKRLDTPDHQWKWSTSDLAERARWDEYQYAYAEAIRATAHGDGPWFVVPNDHKWHGRLVVGEAIRDALARLHPHPPTPSADARAAIAAARAQLAAEDPAGAEAGARS